MFSVSIRILVISAALSTTASHIHDRPHEAQKLVAKDVNPRCRPVTISMSSINTANATVSASTQKTTSIDQTTDISSISTTTTTSRSTSTSSTTSTTSSSTSEVQFDGCQYRVAGTGSFVRKSTWSFTGTSLPDGLTASNGPVNDSTAPFNHYFTPGNALVGNGFLNLLVPGGQNPAASGNNSISAAEVSTSETDILYASVRTNAIFSSVPGTCHGLFFYHSDNAEIDIEYLTDPNSQANNGPQNPIPIWYTNQPLIGGTDPTASTGPAPFDDTAVVHEYRIDWVSGMTKFYIDGVLQKTFTTNVPSVSGPWVFNNWANGDPSWSVGPPAQDNILKIKDITIYYNTTTSGPC